MGPRARLHPPVTKARKPVVGLTVSTALLIVLLVANLVSPGGETIPEADPRNGQVFIQDNLWSTASAQYAIWVAPDGTPYAGSRRRGSEEWTTASLAEVARNPLAAPTADDTHNVYAIATDAEGNVHVAGNMHDNDLRYLRSPARSALQRWQPRPAPSGSESVTYPAFVALPDGTLLFWRRQGISGNGDIYLDALSPGARRWRHLGVVLDGTTSNENPYLHHIAVDPRSGAIHLMFEWRSTGTVDSNSDVGYARSLDGGRSWKRSDGSRYEGPITHASAETVIETPPTGSGLLNGGGLTIDAEGMPHGLATFDRSGEGKVLTHVWLDDGEWRREDVEDSFVDTRTQIAGTPDGRIWALGVRGGELEAIDITPDRDRLDDREIAAVPLGWEPSYDSQALARFGVVETLIPDGETPHVVGADLTEP